MRLVVAVAVCALFAGCLGGGEADAGHPGSDGQDREATSTIASIAAGDHPCPVSPPDDVVRSIPAALPSPRSSVVAAWDDRHCATSDCPGGCLYIVGGKGNDADEARISQIVRYNPLTGTVYIMPTQLEPGRVVGDAVWWRDAMLLLAGSTLPAGAPSGEDPEENLVMHDDILVYRPAQGTLDTLTGSFSSPRIRVAVAATADAVYSFGGEPWTDEIVRIDPDNGTVETMATTLPTPRSRMAAATVPDDPACQDECIYLFGGLDEQGRIDDILRFDPVQDRLDPINASLPEPVQSARAVWHQGQIHILGGWNGERRDEALQFDPVDQTLDDGPQLLGARSSFAAVAAGHAILMAGGLSDPDENARYADIQVHAPHLQADGWPAAFRIDAPPVATGDAPFRMDVAAPDLGLSWYDG